MTSTWLCIPLLMVANSICFCLVSLMPQATRQIQRPYVGVRSATHLLQCNRSHSVTLSARHICSRTLPQNSSATIVTIRCRFTLVQPRHSKWSQPNSSFTSRKHASTFQRAKATRSSSRIDRCESSIRSFLLRKQLLVSRDRSNSRST